MDQPVLQSFLNWLIKRKVTIAFAESVTCGMAASQLADLEGISLVLNGSLIAYCEDVKKSVLGVDSEIIKECTAESKECTIEMAKGLARLIPADLHVAVTGLASPGGSEMPGKPVGSVYISLMYRGKIYNFSEVFKGDSFQIRKQATELIYLKIEEVISQDTF